MAARHDNVKIVSSLDCVEGNDSVVMMLQVCMCVQVCVGERDREQKEDREKR